MSARQKSVQTVWLQDLKDPKVREDFKKVLVAQLNAQVFNKLRSILHQRLLDQEDKEINTDTYKDQDWAYLMAHRNGYKQALIEIMTLIDKGQ